MKPETLVILIPGFAENEADSTCLPSQQAFLKLLKERYPSLNVIVLAFQYPFTQAEYDLYNCHVVAFGGKGKAKLFRLLLWRRVWKKLKQINSTNNIIGLLSFWCGECALVGNRFGKKYGIKHYCWIRGQDAKKGNRYVSRIKTKATELIALSDFIQSEFEKNHGIKPRWVIPAGIDPRQFPEESIARDIDVLGAGSFIPLKQFDLFIDIIKELKQQFPGIQALLCGKGAEEKRLKQLITQHSLQNNINLPGELAHSQLLHQMKRSKIFLHTSEYEGFSNVCIESLCAGASVISFCKPMNDAVPHWHIVHTKEEMIQKAFDMLKDNTTEHKSVLPYTMQGAIEKIMDLFAR